jgi:transcriptional regulator with XRE-family HTH domain
VGQEDFAVVIGVHRTYLGAVERAERNPTLRSVERLAGRLGLLALDLLRADGDLLTGGTLVAFAVEGSGSRRRKCSRF